ncbi:MAG: sodium:solute symporter family protein [bacterium]|jgi:SSS family solute:Na+ symporter|nr:sodium:solute symporter family protein [bacterium]
MAGPVALIIVAIYLLGMLGVGWYTNRYLIKNSSDYLLAGRSLPALLVAVSLSANNIGGGSTVGLVSKAYGEWGLSAVWYVLAAALGIIPMAFFAPKMRKMLAYTIPEVVGRRFGATSHIITAVLHIISLFCLTASQILASGIIVSALLGLPVNTGIIIAAVFTIIYTVMGGLWADTFTDFFQWIVIFCGLLISLPFIIKGAGGWETIMSTLPPAKLSMTGMGLGTIGSLILMYFITFMSGPEMVSRIYSAKDEKAGRTSILLSALIMGVFAFIPALIGIIAFSVFPDLEPSKALSTIVFTFTPAWISGMVCAAIIASTMSSADTDMLCASTIIVKDLYQKYFNPEVEDRHITTITRISNVIIGLTAMCIALLKINIITLNIFSFMLRAAGPFAAFVFGMTWEKASKHSGLVSIILGSAAGIYWKLIGEPYGVLAIIAGTAVGTAAFLLTTWIERIITARAQRS